MKSDRDALSETGLFANLPFPENPIALCLLLTVLYCICLSVILLMFTQGITTFTPAPPSPPPLPYEPTHPIQFTTTQLTSLHGHLQYAAPNGFILISSLVDLLFALSNRTVSVCVLCFANAYTPMYVYQQF